jgi:hypothetical protein
MLPHRQHRVKKDSERSSRTFGEGAGNHICSPLNTKTFTAAQGGGYAVTRLSRGIVVLQWSPLSPSHRFGCPAIVSDYGLDPLRSPRIAKRSIELSEPYSRTCQFDVQFHGIIHSSGVEGPYAKLKADIDRIGSAWDDCGSGDEFCGSPALPARCRM